MIAGLSPSSRTEVLLHSQDYKFAFTLAVMLEGAFLLTFLMLADFTNRLHVLLLLGTVMTYTILAIGLVALGAHVNRAILRVLHAIDEIRAA